MHAVLAWTVITAVKAVTHIAPSFTVEIGHLHGYEGGGSGQSHPENADPDQRVDKHGWS